MTLKRQLQAWKTKCGRLVLNCVFPLSYRIQRTFTICQNVKAIETEQQWHWFSTELLNFALIKHTTKIAGRQKRHSRWSHLSLTWFLPTIWPASELDGEGIACVKWESKDRKSLQIDTPCRWDSQVYPIRLPNKIQLRYRGNHCRR